MKVLLNYISNLVLKFKLKKSSVQYVQTFWRSKMVGFSSFLWQENHVSSYWRHTYCSTVAFPSGIFVLLNNESYQSVGFKSTISNTPYFVYFLAPLPVITMSELNYIPIFTITWVWRYKTGKAESVNRRTDNILHVLYFTRFLYVV